MIHNLNSANSMPLPPNYVPQYLAPENPFKNAISTDSCQSSNNSGFNPFTNLKCTNSSFIPTS